jgi:hypothetical protein
MKVEIKHRYTGAVIWTCEDAINLRDAVQKAAALKVELWRANLSWANLSRANLSRADLSRANLSRANLWRANLSRANLWRANLSRANLSRADDEKLEIKSILQTGPIGSRNDYAICFNTDKGILVRAGCFFDSMEKFKESVDKTHGDSKHGCNYRAWINLCEEWAKE